MNGKNVDHFRGDHPIDNAIRSMHELANGGIWKLLDHAAELGKVSQWIDVADQATDHDFGVGWRIRLDKRPNRREVSLRSFGPVE
jgi:hypothetical protein